MINFLLVVDDKDIELGDYFVKSYFDFSEFLKGIEGVNEKVLENGNCNSQKVEEEIKSFKSNPFVFISFTHGNEDQLLTSSDIIVSDENANIFNQSLFYTSACLTGKNLGEILVKNKCRCFIGYSEEVQIMLQYEDLFISCENYCIKEFCKGKKTIGDSYQEMIKKYDDEIDNLLQSANINDTIAASTLVSNKDCLKYIGETDFSFKDFIINS